MGRIEIGGLVANGLVAADDLPRLESNSERLRVNLQGGIDRMDRPKESGGQPAEFHIDMLARAMGAMSLKAEQQKPGLAASLRVSGEKPPASLQERIDAIASAAKALAKEEAAPPKRSVEDVINANLDWARAQMARIRVMTRSLKVQTVKHQLELNARNVDRTTELLTALFSSPEVLTTEEWTGVVKTMDPGVRRFIATKARGVGRNDLARALTLDDEPGAVPDNIRNVERRHAAARKGLHA
jgi:hypothetical protein